MHAAQFVSLPLVCEICCASLLASSAAWLAQYEVVDFA